MKKTISIILAIMMVATLSVSAFAAVTAVPDATNTKVATGYYVAGAEGAAEYCVDVTFGDMVFKYTDADQVWNEAEDVLAWEEATAGTWSAAGDNTVKVKNRSSEAVSVKVEFAAAEGFEGAVENGTISNVATGAEKVATLTITDGDLTGTDTVEAARTLGTVTVTIDAQLQ